MTDYKCDQCGREFTNREYANLDRVPVNPGDNSRRQGYHTVCQCDAEFWADNWSTTDIVELGDEEVRVHTWFLIQNHGHDDNDLWYETLVRSMPEKRYETKSEAVAGHDAIVNRLQNGQYHWEPTGRKLVIEE